MEVRLEYSPVQLEAAVAFIAQNNVAMQGDTDYIRTSIRENMMEIVEEFPHLLSISTAGYMLVAQVLEEDLDEDENSVRIEILVDPAIGETDMKDVSEVHHTTTKV